MSGHSMDAAQRVNMIRECATLLSAQQWTDIDLILDELGAATTVFNERNNKYDYVVAMLRSADDDTLVRVHEFATGRDTASAGLEPWQRRRLRLFVSHLYTQRRLAAQLKSGLAVYGIDAFVAHDSIEPSLEWRDVIDVSLRTCDAAIALLHDGFPESKWTDQEVGYLLALRVPIMPLILDLDPYGFLAKYQGARCATMTPAAIVKLVLRWLATTPSTAASYADALVTALESADSFDSVRQILPLIEDLPSLNPDQLRRLEAAARGNINVSQGNVRWQPAPTLIRELAARHNPATLASQEPA